VAYFFHHISKNRIVIFFLLSSLSCLGKEPPILNLYTWAGNIDPYVLELFQKETGIVVHCDTYDNDEILEAKLLSGKSNYDIVSPSDPYFSRQLRLNAESKKIFLKLDKKQLSNWHHLYPRLLKLLEGADPNNLYGMPFTWGTTGFGYNVQKIKELLPTGTAVDSIKMLFDPEILKKLASCGVDLVDNPKESIGGALMYLGYPVDSRDPVHFAQAIDVLKAARPYIRHFNANPERTISRLVHGEVCLSQGWSGEILKARQEAKALGKPFEIAYVLPKEGANVWIDVLAIPADAPHPQNAHQFLNFLLRPDIAALNVIYNLQSTSNQAAIPLLPLEIRNDPIINPPQEVFEKIYLPNIASLQATRSQVRAFLKIKMGGRLNEPTFLSTIYFSFLNIVSRLRRFLSNK